MKNLRHFVLYASIAGIDNRASEAGFSQFSCVVQRIVFVSAVRSPGQKNNIRFRLLEFADIRGGEFIGKYMGDPSTG